MTYIAQVYIPKQGILTTRLYKGSKSVTASRYGIHTSDVFVKILCSNQPEKLSWVPATAAKLHTELAGKHLVAGGTENGKILNIGRVSYQGEVIVGKVCSYNVGNALMFFPYHNNEISVKSYEVLVYENKDDSHGHPLYVGLVYIRGFELLPATIFPKQEIARTTAYAHVLNTNQHVKILCSPHQEAFEWTSIQSQDLHQYVHRNLIPGGSEVGENLYIGRVYRNNEVIVGKIFKHERANRGIWFPLGNGPANSLTYEILSYNCEKAGPRLDVRIDLSDKNGVTSTPSPS
ncbi:unnamed protein product [Tenebrio molitor]|nr:unnamed protein product [Tenebrio molitor]